MRAIKVRRDPVCGSRYKYWQMFSRVCELDHAVPTGDLSRYAFGIVEGDRCDDYRIFLRRGIPYILVEQDVWTFRNPGANPAAEREMIENAACILFTSEDHVAFLQQKYTLPPYRVVHLRPLAKDLDFEPLPKLPGQNMVYVGGIVPWEQRDGLFGYRCYHEIFKALMDCGWTVHIYPAWKTADPGGSFASIGCIVHPPVEQGSLYREISQYQAGFQGYAPYASQEYVYACRPNKLWEMLAAGIPTFGFNTGPAARIYDRKWGYVAKSLKDFPAVTERVLAMEIPDDLRRREVMDHDIEAFRELVEIAAAAPRRVRVSRRAALRYPVTLGVDCELNGVFYPKGSRVDRETALALKAAGQLKDPRIV